MYNDDKVKPLHIILPKTSASVKSYDGQPKWMEFLTENDDLFKKCNTIWDKVSNDIKKEFDSKPADKIFFENQNKILSRWSYRFLR